MVKSAIIKKNITMDFKNQSSHSVTLLVTKNGFMAKVTKLIPSKTFTCFFVDKNFNHIPWKLSVTQGLVLQIGEYNRLKGWEHLKEITPTEAQFTLAVALAEKVAANPYYGIDEKVKAAYAHQQPVVVEKSTPPVKIAVVETKPVPKQQSKLVQLKKQSKNSAIGRTLNHFEA
jgi:hypothetical protein